MAEARPPAEAALVPSIAALFAARVAADGDKPALHVKRHGRYVALTWRQVADDVRRLAAALVSLGVQPGDRVAQLSENRYEWIVADLAILLARAVHVPIHATLAGPQIAYQAADSGATVLLLSTAAQAAKLFPEWPRLPRLRHVVTCEPCPSDAAGRPVALLSDLRAGAAAAAGAELERQAVAALTPDSLATILYTSGTTGDPKGVMLTHGNLASNALAVAEAYEFRADDLRLCWLPLSHIFARTCDLYTWIASGTQLALAESRETVVANCAEVRPTLLNAVPYFYEKVQRTLVEKGVADLPGVVQHVFGGRMRFCCSGGAALADHVAEYYHRQGLLLVQGYGLTETSPVITFCTPAAHKLGTVGRAARGVQVRTAADGEVLTRGPHVMTGYWNKPQATAQAIDADGWLHTGDLGQLDEEGYLRITGRKKELIVTSGGKKASPVLLESLLVEDPLIQQAVVLGDGRNYLTALIVVNPVPLAEELGRRGIALDEGQRLCDERVVALYHERIDRRLAGVSQYEQIGRFTLLAQPFSVERDELTPTLKLRRGVIARHYAQHIEAMYG